MHLLSYVLFGLDTCHLDSDEMSLVVPLKKLCLLFNVHHGNTSTLRDRMEKNKLSQEITLSSFFQIIFVKWSRK